MIRLIVAADRMRGIAKQGIQPWHIPDDEDYFNNHTKSNGGDVLIGSTTFKTFRVPLAGRQNFVLTRDKQPIEGAEVVNDLAKFLKSFEGRDLWVAGGANVFAQVLESGQADEIYLTKISADFGCTQFFPEFESNFEEIESSDLHEQNGFLYTFKVYKRKSA